MSYPHLVQAASAKCPRCPELQAQRDSAETAEAFWRNRANNMQADNLAWRVVLVLAGALAATVFFMFVNAISSALVLREIARP